MFASVLAVHCGLYRVPVKGRQISANTPKIKELRRCHRKLERLMTDLHNETFGLQARALNFDMNPAAEWLNWSKSWRHQWRSINWKCRLEELSSNSKYPEMAKMSSIHQELDELHFSSTEIVSSFIERYADRLRDLRADLTSVNSIIELRKSSTKPLLP